MRNFVRKTILMLNVLVAFLLLLAYLSVYVSPATAWVFAFVSLAYPFLLVANIAFIIFWAVFKKWYFVLSLLVVLLGWNALKSSVQVHFNNQTAAETSTISVLTYNVRLFNHYQWDKDTTAWQRIVDYIHGQNPDIVCFQEFITLPNTHHDLQNLKKMMQPLGYSHVYYTDRVPRKLNFGMATFSRYPIVRKQMIDFEESLNGSICSDVVIRDDTIRVFNCHLQSIRLTNDYNNLLDSLIFNYSEKQLDELREISVKMREAFIQRAEQVDIMAEKVHESPYPVILCGDFNDTPVSYTYHKLSRKLNDAFIGSGTGMGTTFRGNFPYVRIDYLLYSDEFKAYHYKTGKINWSDHYPVMARFRLKMADWSDLRSHRKE